MSGRYTVLETPDPNDAFPIKVMDTRVNYIVAKFWTRMEAVETVRKMNAHDDLVAALRDLRDACTDAYKAGRIPAEPFVRAGNVLGEIDAKAN